MSISLISQNVFPTSGSDVAFACKNILVFTDSRTAVLLLAQLVTVPSAIKPISNRIFKMTPSLNVYNLHARGSPGRVNDIQRTLKRPEAKG
jgi:hypothetical protein